MHAASFFTRLTKVQWLLAAVVLSLAFPGNAYAKSVACLATKSGTICFHSKLSCSQRIHDFRSGNPSCVDYALMKKPSDAVFLTRERGGSASITIGGKKIQIASAALESFLDRKEAEASAPQRRGTSEKLMADRFRMDLEAFLKTDKGLVSDQRLTEISRELNIPVPGKR
jgi:hypothetical protein